MINFTVHIARFEAFEISMSNHIMHTFFVMSEKRLSFPQRTLASWPDNIPARGLHSSSDFFLMRYKEGTYSSALVP